LTARSIPSILMLRNLFVAMPQRTKHAVHPAF
jgi:hypothetical protein